MINCRERLSMISSPGREGCPLSVQALRDFLQQVGAETFFFPVAEERITINTAAVSKRRLPKSNRLLSRMVVVLNWDEASRVNVTDLVKYFGQRPLCGGPRLRSKTFIQLLYLPKLLL